MFLLLHHPIGVKQMKRLVVSKFRSIPLEIMARADRQFYEPTKSCIIEGSGQGRDVSVRSTQPETSG